ncbi:YceI family protein [Flavisolibacter ginsenosidimutans]|uniref:YceI family protein n=1 Tax=Flavisolibacter ginsenosidimutans TaxID=661481 RepID=A0A5B8UGT3_9BACT|nr:YceI family protein [Flavisolibacter ginsenosidimutans]QEC55536.1 YceI family protein [Flavisolibacter ginsenosidimutans]
MRQFFKAPYIIIVMYVLSMAVIVACRHDDQLIESSAVSVKRGTAVLLPGNMTTGNTNEWKLDKVHSNVMWQTRYMGAAGLLTGRFNQFGMAKVTDAKAINYVTTGQPLVDADWAFYESDPSKTFFNGYVQINTSNTGEPGRDNGCNITTLGTVAVVTGTQNLTPTNLAKIETTKVEFDPSSAGYLVTLNLTFKGGLTAPKTISIPGKLAYVPRQTVQIGTAAGYDVFGLQLQFQFSCRDFGITSTSVADKIEIECNMNFNNK